MARDYGALVSNQTGGTAFKHLLSLSQLILNNLRLKEIATGDESGTWGTSTNTNLELIGEALGFGTEAIMRGLPIKDIGNQIKDHDDAFQITNRKNLKKTEIKHKRESKTKQKSTIVHHQQ